MESFRMAVPHRAERVVLGRLCLTHTCRLIWRVWHCQYLGTDGPKAQSQYCLRSSDEQGFDPLLPSLPLWSLLSRGRHRYGQPRQYCESYVDRRQLQMRLRGPVSGVESQFLHPLGNLDEISPFEMTTSLPRQRFGVARAEPRFRRRALQDCNCFGRRTSYRIGLVALAVVKKLVRQVSC